MYMSYSKLCLREFSLVLQFFNKDSSFYGGIFSSGEVCTPHMPHLVIEFIVVLAECTEINAVVE